MGNIGREVIKSWLENYQGLMEDDKSLDDMPTNSGCKPDDGIKDSVINRIVLDQALKDMKWQVFMLYSCCRARWIDKDGLNFTLRRLGLTKDQYYKRCDWVIDYLYYHINGMLGQRAKLVVRVKCDRGRW